MKAQDEGKEACSSSSWGVVAVTACRVLAVNAPYATMPVRQGTTTIRPLREVVVALALIREVAPGQAVLTHLPHTMEYGEVSDRLSPMVRLAYDGLTVEIQE